MRVLALSPLSRAPRTAQRLAVDGDDITVLQQRSDIGKYLPKSGIERLGIDHPKCRRKGVM